MGKLNLVPADYENTIPKRLLAVLSKSGKWLSVVSALIMNVLQCGSVGYAYE